MRSSPKGLGFNRLLISLAIVLAFRLACVVSDGFDPKDASAFGIRLQRLLLEVGKEVRERIRRSLDRVLVSQPRLFASSGSLFSSENRPDGPHVQMAAGTVDEAWKT